MGRRRGKQDQRTCDHEAPALFRRTGGGFEAVCLSCDTVGPRRSTAEEARRALLELAADRREG